LGILEKIKIKEFSMEHIVKIDRVSKKYGDKQILKDIS